MSQLPLAARIVEVIADLGAATSPQYRYGSGCLVADRTVLTAAHVIADAVGVTVRDGNKREYAATVEARFVGDPCGPGPDVALMSVVDITPVIPIGLAAVDRDSPTGDAVERCHAIGYPEFMEERAADGASMLRDTVDAIGHVPVLSRLAGGLLSVQVTHAPRELPNEGVALGDSEWSGMSGAPVLADGWLLGVVTEHAPRAGASTITATPLTALQSDPTHPGWGAGVDDPDAWWQRLGVSGTAALRRLPPRRRHRDQDGRRRSAGMGRGDDLGPAEPAYWATVREVQRRTGLLVGREHELAEIAAFAVGAECYRWLVGGAWTGKTALLAEAVTTALPDRVDVVAYFMSRREADADSQRFITAVVPQLAYLLGQEASGVDLHQFRALWERATERATAENRHLLLVVDGLDEDLRPPRLPSVAAVLPAAPGGRAHVLVASRPHPELPGDVPHGHPLTRATAVAVERFEGAAELARAARQEIDELIVDQDGLAVEVLGLLTAAAGPLAVEDLASLTDAAAPRSHTRQIRRLLTAEAARSLQPVAPAAAHRYQFAHDTLLAHARSDADLSDPSFRRRIHRWAQRWSDSGWRCSSTDEVPTPRYLLETYPSTLADDPERLVSLVTDVAWVASAIEGIGVDRVMADLQRARAADPTSAAVAALLTTVTGQAHLLRGRRLRGQSGYVLRQLGLQAAELSENRLADAIRARLRSEPTPGLMLQWTTRRTSRALTGELGRHDGRVRAVAALADGRVVSAGTDGRVLVWDPDRPEIAACELARDAGSVRALAALADGRVVSGGDDGRVLVWDPARPEIAACELGRRAGSVRALAALADGRVVSAGDDGHLLVWDPARPEIAVCELGRRAGSVLAIVALADGRVVSAGDDGRVLLWDPAQPDTPARELGRHDVRVHAVAALTDGRVVSAVGSVALWDPAQPSAPARELGRYDDFVRAVAALADGRVVSAGLDGRVLVWDPAQPDSPARELGRHDGWVPAVAVLADGRVVSGGDDGRVLLWDPVQSYTLARELGYDDLSVLAVAALADGRVISAGRGVQLWDPAAQPDTPAGEHGYHAGSVLAVAALADARVISAGADGRVVLWDPAETDTFPRELGRHAGAVQAVAALADGRVVSGGDDGRVLVWDPVQPEAVACELGRHHGAVQAVAALADGRVVSAGEDLRVLVWDPARPDTPVRQLGRHDDSVLAVAALADGYVVSAGADRCVLLWDPARPDTQPQELNCSPAALAAGPLYGGEPSLVLAHAGRGISLWTIVGGPSQG